MMTALMESGRDWKMTTPTDGTAGPRMKTSSDPIIRGPALPSVGNIRKDPSTLLATSTLGCRSFARTDPLAITLHHP